MKSKLCWIPFIPLTVAAAAFPVLQKLGVLFEPDSTIPFYFSVAAVLIMFAVNIIFVAADKKTSPVYILARNIPAAVFAVLAAGMIASKSALTAILALQNKTFDAFVFAIVAFGMLTAICFVIIALAHIQGRNFLPRMGAFFLAMPVWSGLMLINEFLNNRTVSVISINPIALFCYAIFMIYTFKLAMLIATVKGKNPVKAMFLYGFPLAAIGIVIGLVNIVGIILNGLDYSENVIAFAFMSIGLYAVFLNIEITKNALTKDEQIVKYDLDDFDEEQRVYGAFQDNTVVAPDEQTGDYDYDYTFAGDDAESFVTEKDDRYTEDYDYSYSYGGQDTSEADDLVVAPEADDDDAIYVEEKKVETFEEGVFSAADKANHVFDEKNDYSDEQLKKIDDLIDDINKG